MTYYLKKAMPWIMSALGVSNAKDIVFDWQDSQKELSMSPNTFTFVVVCIIY
jgi:hypothetical protein